MTLLLYGMFLTKKTQERIKLLNWKFDCASPLRFISTSNSLLTTRYIALILGANKILMTNEEVAKM